MRSLTEALLYPGVGLLEATNLATGRGTDTPFERVGAPWIDPRPSPRRSTPRAARRPVRADPVHAHAAAIRRTAAAASRSSYDWSRFEPLRLGIALAVLLRDLYPEEWKPAGLLRLLADRATYRRHPRREVGGRDHGRLGTELGEFREVRDAVLTLSLRVRIVFIPHAAVARAGLERRRVLAAGPGRRTRS